MPLAYFSDLISHNTPIYVSINFLLMFSKFSIPYQTLNCWYFDFRTLSLQMFEIYKLQSWRNCLTALAMFYFLATNKPSIPLSPQSQQNVDWILWSHEPTKTCSPYLSVNTLVTLMKKLKIGQRSGVVTVTVPGPLIQKLCNCIIGRRSLEMFGEVD